MNSSNAGENSVAVLRELASASRNLDTFQSAILRSLLDVLGDVERLNLATVDFAISDESLVIYVRPALPICTPIDIYIHGGSMRDVEICAGDNSGIWLSENVKGAAGFDEVSLVRAIVLAIMSGRLRETIVSRGSAAYKWEYSLDCHGREIRGKRVNFPSLMRNLARTRKSCSVCFPSYFDQANRETGE